MAGMDHWLRHQAKFKYGKKFNCKEIIDYLNDGVADEEKVELAEECSTEEQLETQNS